MPVPETVPEPDPAIATSEADRPADSTTVDPRIPPSPDRDARGLFLRGNRVAVRHGLRAQIRDALAAERQDFEHASLIDDGGAEAIPTRRRSLHTYRARLHTHIHQLSDALEQYGLFDHRGHLRSAWLQRLEGLIDRARALDATLGLDRRAKRIPTLDDVLKGAPDE